MPPFKFNLGRRLALVVGAVSLAATLPYGIGWLRQTPLLSFGGAFINPIDVNAYFSMMYQGRAGQVLFDLLYTTEPHPRLFLFEFYIALGWLAQGLHWPLMLVYHTVRLAAGVWLLIAAYEFLRVHLRRAVLVWIAFLLAAVGSGLGWLKILLAPTAAQSVVPMDFWFVDAYVFLSIFVVPHFSIAAALSLHLITALTQQADQAHGSRLLVAAFASAGLTLLHPRLAPIVYTVATLVALSHCWHRPTQRRPILLTLAAAGLAALPMGLFLLTSALFNPTIAWLIRQDITLSPPVSDYGLGYGLLFIFGIIGALRLRQRRQWREWPLLIWTATVAVGVYFPVQIQRRFALGVQIPLAALAALGVLWSLARVRRRFARLRFYPPQRLRLFLLNLILAFSMISPAYLILGYSLKAWQRNRGLFWSRDVLAAADWLGTHQSSNECVLTAYSTGNMIPGRSGARVYLGHWSFTFDVERKHAEITEIFSGQRPPAHCRYLLWSEAERELSDQWQPQLSPKLQLRFATQTAAIYEVRP